MRIQLEPDVVCELRNAEQGEFTLTVAGLQVGAFMHPQWTSPDRVVTHAALNLRAQPMLACVRGQHGG